MLLSRRADSDDTQNHQIFIDTRSTWENPAAGSAAILMKIRLPLIATADGRSIGLVRRG